MNGVYDIYKLDNSGNRDSLITTYTHLSGELNRAKSSQFTLTGTCIGTSPMALADRIEIVRNNTQIFSGYVSNLLTDCEDVANDIKTWEAFVSDDESVLSWRYVFATSNNTAPAGIEVSEDVYDKLPNNNDESSTQSALNRMLYYVRKHAGANAHSSRRLVTVSENDDNTRGEQGRSAYHIKRLSEVVSEIGNESELYCKVNTDSSGARVLTVPAVRDRTSAVIVSPEFGNVAAWKREEEYPIYNAVWVISGASEEDDGNGNITQIRVWVYAEDATSIAKYGRIESVVTKSDVKIVPADPDNEDVVPITRNEVVVMLEEEASKRLKSGAATVKWTVTMAEYDGCAFMTDWKVGDKVTCVIEGQSFESIIETAQINYENGIETVTPVIGEVEEGVYSKLFKQINGIDTRLKAEEEN